MRAGETPRAAVEKISVDPVPPAGAGERFVGYVVMGTPLAGGHYLALRVMLASTVGPAYRAVWHRDPAGSWAIYTTTRPEQSCPRYFGAQARSETVPAIDVDWTSPWELRVRMGTRLDWRIELGATPATRLMSGMGTAMPAAAWRSGPVLGAMGPVAGPALRVGKVRLRGRVPNGQWFTAAPVRVWRVTGGHARLDGLDLPAAGVLDGQARMADFWMPRRGIFSTGLAAFEALDPARHHTVAGSDPRPSVS